MLTVRFGYTRMWLRCFDMRQRRIERALVPFLDVSPRMDPMIFMKNSSSSKSVSRSVMSVCPFMQ